MKTRILLLLLISFPLVMGAATKHPSIADPESARCDVCHKELLEGQVHSIVEEGCDNCHMMEKVEGKTMVSLIEKGSDLCFMCHDSFTDVMERKHIHGACDECTNCHNPHSSSTDKLLSTPRPDLCFNCHDKEEVRKEIHQNQPVHGTDCTGCHDPHGNNTPKMIRGSVRHAPFEEAMCDACHRSTRTKKVRLVSPEPDLCYACHGDKEKAFKGTSIHDPVGRGNCTACHDPHLSEAKNLLLKGSPQLCHSCHSGIKELVSKNLHAPIEDGCDSCHGVHATNRPHLLLDEMMPKNEVSSLCFSCHDAGELKPKHRGTEMGSLNCTICHNPHGSPEKKLMNTGSVHAVFEECDTCHGDGIDTNEDQPDLCFMCHENIQESVEKASIKHDAIDTGCTSCHTPHVSREPHLFRGDHITVCGECHDMNHPVYHGVIESVGCHACHEPHGGKNEQLLKASGNELCLYCHDKETADNPFLKMIDENRPVVRLSKDKTFGHPSRIHPVVGKQKGKKPVFWPEGMKEMSCLSCHNPHGGKTVGLFQFDKENQYELCFMCHRK